MKKVIVLVGNWKGTTGALLDWIPGTDWYNVLVRPGLRLALKPGEFACLT